MLLYKYQNDTKELIGFFEAYIDPLESEKQNKPVYVFPPDTTIVAPGISRDGYVQVFNGNNWEEVEDNRGKIVWKNGKEPMVIEALGPIPKDCTLERVLSLKEIKEQKYAEIKKAYHEAYNNKVTVGKFQISIDQAPELKKTLKAFEDFEEFVFEDEVTTPEEARETLALLNERSIKLVDKKKKLEEKVRVSTNKEEVLKLKVLF